MKELPRVFLLQFAPETWSSLRKLRAFVGPPMSDDSNVRIGLRDCESHLDKVVVAWRVLARLRPNLKFDREELDRLGGTDNINAQEYALICESIVAALYSAIDGLRTFIYGMHRRVQGVQRSSNGKLFDRAAANEYGAGFPEGVRRLLAHARDEWFLRLRGFRTELTHGSTGSCHFDETTNHIQYFNSGIEQDGRTFIIDDIEAYLREVETKISFLIEAIAEFHLATLESIPQFKICGMYRGRWYGRMVAFSPGLTFADGHCMSYDWFEKLEGHFCPLADKCQAYLHKWPAGTSEVTGPAPTTNQPQSQ